MAKPDRSQWWTFTRRGYRLSRTGAEALNRMGVAMPDTGKPRRAGQFVSGNTLRNIRDTWIDSRKGIGRDLAAGYKQGGDITTWVKAMREEIADTTRAQYILARGGLGNMTARDWGILGNHLRGQYQYLNDFASQVVSNPGWSEARIAARAQLYFEASGTMYERGNQEGKGAPRLPAYPGDGGTACGSNCKCYWDIQEDGSWWLCYWRLRAAEHCSGCVENAARWSPLTIPKTQFKSEAEVRTFLGKMLEVA